MSMLHWLFCKEEYNRFRSRTRFCRRNLILVYGKRVPLRYERVRSPGKYGGLRRNQPYLCPLAGLCPTFLVATKQPDTDRNVCATVCGS
ncbi:MAG: hypothetical protein GX804_03450 [Lentisphaerae bacterium]|nr:hypothetical protein [Lentisphaerota bacterium]